LYFCYNKDTRMEHNSCVLSSSLSEIDTEPAYAIDVSIKQLDARRRNHLVDLHLLASQVALSSLIDRKGNP